MKHIFITSLTLVLMGSAAAYAQVVTPLKISVNCSSGQKIQPHLNNKTRARKLILTISGVCSENLNIDRSDVVITGPTPGQRAATISGRIDLVGAQRIVIRHLKVNFRNSAKTSPEGEAMGIAARLGTSLTLLNVAIAGHRDYGLGIYRNAVVEMKNSFVAVPSTGLNAVFIADGGHMQMFKSTVISNSTQANEGAAIGLYRNASARIRNGSTVRHTNASPTDPWTGVAIQAGDDSSFRVQKESNTIEGNIVVYDSSSADFRDSNITGLLAITDQSHLELRSSVTATGNASVGNRGYLEVNGATYSGTINCWNDGAVKSAGGATTNNCAVY